VQRVRKQRREFEDAWTDIDDDDDDDDDEDDDDDDDDDCTDPGVRDRCDRNKSGEIEFFFKANGSLRRSLIP
jgi:hypothetical protein